MSSLQSPADFNWPLAYEAEALLSQYINAFLGKHSLAASLARRMHDETGTEFFEWTDSFVVSRDHEARFPRGGLCHRENRGAAAHPRAGASARHAAARARVRAVAGLARAGRAAVAGGIAGGLHGPARLHRGNRRRALRPVSRGHHQPG
ncbi:MAG: hypothetical protein WDM96_13220 [Lacunisphaera sp.]